MGSLTEEEGNELAEIFRLLGDPGRLRIVLACREKPIAVGVLAKVMNMSPPLVSHHLRLLRAARLLKAKRVGKNVFYALADAHVGHMLSDMVAHTTECNPKPAKTPAGLREKKRKE